MRSILESNNSVTPAERASATENNIGKQALPQIEVNAVYGIHNNLVDAGIFLTNKFWVEENFGGSEPLRTQLYSVT